ncbi:MAG: NUDIX domain-containing protein [Candidatus Saccharimonas sp.]
MDTLQLQVGVKALLFNSEGALLLLKSSKLRGENLVDIWDIPGGRIAPGEQLLDALAREIKEETGLTLASEPTLLTAQDIIPAGKNIHVIRLTYCTKATGSITLSDEHSDYAWADPSELNSYPIDLYVLRVLKDYHDKCLDAAS